MIELPLLDEESFGASASAHEARDWHYAQAGIYIASHCHLLLAIWDGRQTGLLGGTAQIVRYQLSGQKPRLLERRRRQAGYSPLGGDNERFVFHAVCSRAADDGAPLPPLQPLQTYWRSIERTTPGDSGIPDELKAMLNRISQFNHDATRYTGPIGAYIASKAQQRGLRIEQLGPITRRFAAADWLALHFQRRVTVAMRALYTIAALMGIAFVLYEQLSQSSMIFVFLLLFASGFLVDRMARWRSWHRKYLDYRALAEGLRVQSFWHRAGLSVTGDAEFAHDNFLQKQDVELGWIRNIMRSAGLDASRHPFRSPTDDLEHVIREWVGAPGDCGQLDYYERSLLSRTRTHRQTERIGTVALVGGICICVFLAVFVFTLPVDTRNELVALMATLSIIAAVREAYAYRKADKELIKQYRFMRRIFSTARQALDRAEDEDEQREILRALGEAALAEHAEWTLMHRERPLEHGRP